MSSDYTQPSSQPPQYGQGPQYGQYPQYSGGGGQYGAPTRTNPLAIASLVCGIGQILLGLIAGIPGIILGFIALNQIKTKGEGGRGLAIAGIVLGFIGVALFLVVIIAVVSTHNSSG
jgi:Domain of unknown function (DUF4190)